MAVYPEGTVLTLKKNHPCGSKDWVVLRAGWAYRLRCVGCDHIMLMKREQLMKLVKQSAPPTGESG